MPAPVGMPRESLKSSCQQAPADYYECRLLWHESVLTVAECGAHPIQSVRPVQPVSVGARRFGEGRRGLPQGYCSRFHGEWFLQRAQKVLLFAVWPADRCASCRGKCRREGCLWVCSWSNCSTPFSGMLAERGAAYGIYLVPRLWNRAGSSLRPPDGAFGDRTAEADTLGCSVFTLAKLMVPSTLTVISNTVHTLPLPV